MEQRELVTRSRTLEKRAPFCVALQSRAVDSSIGAFGNVGIGRESARVAVEWGESDGAITVRVAMGTAQVPSERVVR
ncbi:hypothetical protein MTO96_018053 [Rhipicephalus appendiculatus]